MKEEKETFSTRNVTIFLIIVLVIGIRAFKAYDKHQNRQNQQKLEQLAEYQEWVQEGDQAEIEDTFIEVPSAQADSGSRVSSDKHQESAAELNTDQLEVQETPTENPADTDNVPATTNDSHTTQTSPEKKALTHFIQKFGRATFGNNRLFGPPPVVTRDGKRLASFVGRQYKENGSLDLVSVDIKVLAKNAPLEIIYDDSYYADDEFKKHDSQSVTLNNIYGDHILHFSALADNAWFWVVGKSRLDAITRIESRLQDAMDTCWYRWSGQSTETPRKTCLDSSEERGAIIFTDVSKDASKAIFTQLQTIEKIEQKKGYSPKYKLELRVIVVDLDTGKVHNIAPEAYRFEYAHEEPLVGAYFLDDTGSKAIFFTSSTVGTFSMMTRGDDLNVSNWDTLANTLSDEFQVIPIAKISRLERSPGSDQNILIGRHHSVAINSSNGEILETINFADYPLASGSESNGAKYHHSILLRDNTLMLGVKDDYHNRSWQLFNIESKQAIGQKPKMITAMMNTDPENRWFSYQKDDEIVIFEILGNQNHEE